MRTGRNFGNELPDWARNGTTVTDNGAGEAYASSMHTPTSDRDTYSHSAVLYRPLAEESWGIGEAHTLGTALKGIRNLGAYIPKAEGWGFRFYSAEELLDINQRSHTLQLTSPAELDHLLLEYTGHMTPSASASVVNIDYLHRGKKRDLTVWMQSETLEADRHHVAAALGYIASVETSSLLPDPQDQMANRLTFRLATISHPNSPSYQASLEIARTQLPVGTTINFAPFSIRR